jgi:SAM-dependent methyltransferase
VGFSDAEYSRSDNYIEKHHAYPEKLTALGVETPNEFPLRYPRVRVVQYDGIHFPFKDKAFDVCWSNAVLEHVGDENTMVIFLKEIKRVARTVFLTTPNKYFPVEVHTRTPLLHFFPKPVFDSYLRRIGKGWAAGDYMHLLSLKPLRRLLEAAGMNGYRVIRDRFLGFVLDYVVIFRDLTHS